MMHRRSKKPPPFTLATIFWLCQVLKEQHPRVSSSKVLHSLKLTVRHPKRKRESIPTILFHVRSAVSFRVPGGSLEGLDPKKLAVLK